MPFTKNQIITLEIEALSNDGNGVAHKDGQAVFVPLTAPGDVAEVRIVKPMKTYAFGRVEKLLTAGPGRVRQDCPVAGPCGGCGLRHISYEAECTAKTQFVRDAFARLGKLDVPVPDVLGAPDTDRYRNKVQRRERAYCDRLFCRAQPPYCGLHRLQAAARVDERAGRPRLCAAGGERHHCLQRGDPHGPRAPFVHASGLAQRAAAFVLCGKRQRSAERGGNLRHTAKRVCLNDDFGQPQQ